MDNKFKNSLMLFLLLVIAIIAMFWLVEFLIFIFDFIKKVWKKSFKSTEVVEIIEGTKEIKINKNEGAEKVKTLQEEPYPWRRSNN